MQYNIRLPVFELATQLGSTGRGGDILGECNYTRNGADGDEIDADDERVERHSFGCDLQPPSRCSAQVDAASGRLEERVLFVELDELERRTGSVALFSEEVC